MCQSLESLAVLQAWEQQGVLVLNTPAAVRGLLASPPGAGDSPQSNHPALPAWHNHPTDETAASGVRCPALPESTAGWWVKRGDAHAMQLDDVLFIRHATDLPAQLARLSPAWHWPCHRAEAYCRPGGGNFYAVRGHVLHAFAPYEVHCPPIDDARLNTLARQASAVLGLDIYGGDCLLASDFGTRFISLTSTTGRAFGAATPRRGHPA